MGKKLSIMIPVFNMQQYLDECLQSLVGQNWEDAVEIIIVDDGSTDDSRKICQKYANKYSYISLYCKSNGGVASARNMALEHASGEYFYWIDPDDYIDDEFWDKIEPLLKMGYDFIFFDYAICFSNMNLECKFGNCDETINKEKLVHLFSDGVKMKSHLPTKILKKTWWEGIKFNEKLSLCEDYDVLTKIVPRAERIFYLNDILYYYRQRSDSICHNISVYDMTSVYKLVQERYEHFCNLGYDVDTLGIRYVEYCYMRVINSNLNLCDDTDKYQELYHIMHKRLLGNKQVLLQSNVLSGKEKIIFYLLAYDMKALFTILKKIWNFLKI